MSKGELGLGVGLGLVCPTCRSVDNPNSLASMTMVAWVRVGARVGVTVGVTVGVRVRVSQWVTLALSLVAPSQAGRSPPNPRPG